MRWADLLRFSGGALRGHRLRTVFSLLGVAVGIASVILLTGLGEGARLYVTAEFANLGSNLLFVIPGKTETFGGAPMVSTAVSDLTVADAEALAREIPEIRRAAPLVMGTAPVEHAGRRRDATVVGSTHDLLEVRRLRMATGRFIPPGEKDAQVAVLGTKVAQGLFGSRNPLGETVRIGGTRFRIIGVLAPRGTSIGVDLDQVVEVPVETALRMFNRSSLFRIMAQVRSGPEMVIAQQKARRLLTERHGREDITIFTQDSLLSTFGTILRALTAALAGIAAVSLTVAGIGIMNVMLVSVSERTREIGLLKAIGVTQGQVLRVFLLEAALISTAGGALGLLAGFGLGRLVELLVPDLPARPPAWAVLAALGVSVAVGLTFGALPARRAAALEPVQALTGRRG